MVGKAKCAIREKKKEIAFSQGTRKPEKLEELEGRELLFFVCTLDNFAQIGSKRSNLQLNLSVLCIAEKTWNNAGYGKEQSEGHRDKRRALAGNPKLEYCAWRCDGATELKVGSRQVSKLQVFSSSTYGCLATYKRGSLL